MKTFGLLFAAALLAAPARAADEVDVTDWPGVAVDIRYATTNNFMGENLYGDDDRCRLHARAAEKLRKAAAHLGEARPGWKLLLFDCLRPLSVQRRLWARVKDTPQRDYVADPAVGSVHNYGFAVDLSLLDAAGREVDMGTAYDAFTPLSEPRLEKTFAREGKLSPRQLENRRLLRRVMGRAGFHQLPNEWWHYDALPKKRVLREFRPVD